MSLFDVSTIHTVDAFVEHLANDSCCGSSGFVKASAKAAHECFDTENKLIFIEKLITVSDGQLSKAWKDKATELLK